MEVESPEGKDISQKNGNTEEKISENIPLKVIGILIIIIVVIIAGIGIVKNFKKRKDTKK